MHLEDYFDFLAPNDIRLKGHRIGIESILYEYLYNEKTPKEILSRFPTLNLEKIYATLLYYHHRQAEIDHYLNQERQPKMTYDILIETLSPNTYQATVLGWPDLRVVGESETMVVEQIWRVLQQQLAQNKVVQLDVETGKVHPSHPWKTVIGIWKDDPTFDDFQEKMATYRRQMDEDSSYDAISP